MSEKCDECFQPILGEGPGWCPACSYARGKADGMAEANIAQMLSDSFAHGKDADLAKVVAWLHGPLPGVTMCRCGHVNVQDIIDALERGEHKK